MKLRKAIKRIVALGMGATMVGASIVGALAYDLNDYPAPFVSNGQFDAVYVVGRNALSSDTLGVAAITNAIPTYGQGGGGSAITPSDDVAYLETSGTELVLGDAINYAVQTLDDGDLPNILADGEVEEASTGSDHEYTQKITLGSQPKLVYNTNSGDPEDLDDPEIYVSFSGVTDTNDVAAAGNLPIYYTTIDFDAFALNLSHGEDIVLFGTKWTFSSSMSEISTTSVKLLGSSTTEIVRVGERLTINGVEVEVLGANADANSATVFVAGETESVVEGETIDVTVNGVDTKVYVKEIFIQTVPEPATVAVELSIGSRTLELRDGLSVKVDDDAVRGTKCEISSTSGNIDKIYVGVYPPDLHEDDGNVERDYLLVGESIVDPVWGTFKFDFAGVTVPLDNDDRGYLEIARGDEGKITFTNKAGDTYSLDIWDKNLNLNVDSDAAQLGADFNWDLAGAAGASASNVTIGEDEYVLVKSGTSPMVTQIIKTDAIRNSSSGDDLEITDLSTGAQIGEYVTKDHLTLELSEGDVTGVQVDYTAKTLNMGASQGLTYQIVTDDDLLLTLFVNGSNATTKVGIMEDYEDADSQSRVGGAINVTLSWDTGSDNEFDVNDVALSGMQNSNALQSADSDDHEYGVTDFGTYIDFDADDKTYVKIYPPPQDVEEVNYQLAISGIGATVGSGEVGSSGSDVVVVPPTAGVFDDSISSVSANNMIVVGGPCANSVAATLMDNPANCAEGFEPGKGIIKLFEHANGKVSILVAGYSGDDTMLASLVVADKTKLTAQADGVDEIIVQGASLSSVVITYPTEDDGTTGDGDEDGDGE